MAVESKKVLDYLNSKFKGKSITKDFKTALAEKLASKIDNDTDIESYIDDREDFILEASNEGDRRATAAAKKTTTETVKKITGVETPAEEEPVDDMGKLMKMVTSLTETVGKLQSEKTANTLQERFSKDERLKGIDPKLLKGRVPKTEEELEAAIAEAAEDLKDFIKTESEQQQQQQPNRTLQTRIGGGFGDKPVHQTSIKVNTPAEKAKEVPAEITAFTDKLNKSTAVKTT